MSNDFMIPYALRPSGITLDLRDLANTDTATRERVAAAKSRVFSLLDCKGRGSTDANYGVGCDPDQINLPAPDGGGGGGGGTEGSPDCQGRVPGSSGYGSGCDPSDPTKLLEKPSDDHPDDHKDDNAPPVDCNGLAKTDPKYGTDCDTKDPTKQIPIYQKPLFWVAVGGGTLVLGAATYALMHKKKRR